MSLEIEDTYSFPMFEKLTSDVRQLSVVLDRNNTKALVDIYYNLQDNRIAFAAQARELEKAGSPHELVQYMADSVHRLEKSLKSPLLRFANQSTTGAWALSQYGIGPVITAGLLAHIDITKAPTAGSIWRYAGLDPTSVWNKGEKRPYNAELKTLCWKIGQSFMKFSAKDQCFYGKLYLSDKARRIELNDSGQYADRAKEILSTKNFRMNKTRSVLEAGKLSDAQIDAQARRYAVKIFLSHFHAVAYQDHYGVPAPRPYVLEHGGHVHEIEVPNNPF
jgi:hypothetical protein